MTRRAPQALQVPAGHPARDVEGRSANREDVRWALIRAARYLAQGGSRDAVEPYVDEWLDYWLELDFQEELGRL